MNLLHYFRKKKKEETKPLPTYEDLFRKAEEYVVECGLRQFCSKNDVTLFKGKFIAGYEQAIKDYVDPKYKPK
jgi:hypothetical protein